MHYLPDSLYHIYNRGNQKQLIFFTPENYHYFIRKMDKLIASRCDLLSYCLMPNHFHMLVHTNERSTLMLRKGIMPIQNLSEGIRLLLSGYAKGINKKMGFTGNLFQQKTKAKIITGEELHPGRITFDYIHQNPLKAGLVTRLENWEYSSFKDYVGMRGKSICNISKAGWMLNLPSPEILYQESYQLTKPEMEKLILHSNHFVKDDFQVTHIQPTQTRHFHDLTTE